MVGYYIIFLLLAGIIVAAFSTELDGLEAMRKYGEGSEYDEVLGDYNGEDLDEK